MNHSDDDEGHLETQARICPNCGDDHVDRPCTAKELQRALDHERKDYKALLTRHEANLCCWEVSERTFVTKRESDVRKAQERAEKALEGSQKEVARLTEELKARNQSCALWITGYNARMIYTNHLERRLQDLGVFVSRYQVGTVEAMVATDEELVKQGVIDFTQPLAKDVGLTRILAGLKAEGQDIRMVTGSPPGTLTFQGIARQRSLDAQPQPANNRSPDNLRIQGL